MHTYIWIDVCDYIYLLACDKKEAYCLSPKSEKTLPRAHTHTHEFPCHMSSGENALSSIYTG